MPMNSSRIAIFGAGSIGAYVGAALLAGGADVQLIARARVCERFAREGIAISDLEGRRERIDASRILCSEDPAALREAGLILVTVKSADTAAAAQALAAHARRDALVISLQNGIGNADTLRAALPGMTVLGGMVPFNVVQTGDGRYHRGTEGRLMVEASPALSRWLAAFEQAGLSLMERADFASVQWGKLLLNLNNPVNALSGLPLKAQLSQRDYRRCLALLMEEALRALEAAGITPAQIGGVPPKRLPFMLRLPDWIYRRIASASLRIDPEARSSMWEDLQAGRRTEIDYLNGAVLRLAQQAGMDAVANRRIVDLVHAAEQGKAASMKGAELLAILRR
jgi:2-dehydropantoate 2-reductase